MSKWGRAAAGDSDVSGSGTVPALRTRVSLRSYSRAMRPPSPRRMISTGRCTLFSAAKAGGRPAVQWIPLTLAHVASEGAGGSDGVVRPVCAGILGRM